MSDRRTYCADLCLAAAEPMLGTAPQVEVWLLLEYDGTWKPKALADNGLPAGVARWFEGVVAEVQATGLAARPQLIRGAGRSGPPALFVACRGGLFRCRAEGYEAMQSVESGVFRELATAGSAAAFEPVSEAHYFVCTNGQRDLCCARYGRPAFERFEALVGARAWQTTHLGGHRFAPNVLALPQGALYGRVFADDVADFVARVERGELAVRHLRGRSAYPPEAQVGEVRVDGATALVAVEGGDVVFDTQSGRRSVSVRRSEQALEVIASCGRTDTESVYPFL